MQYDVNGTRLLLWDDADVRSRLDEVVVAAPVSGDVDPDAVFSWLETRCAAGEDAEAVFFTAVATGSEEDRAATVTGLRELGYEVHVRPARSDGASPAMAPTILSRIEQASRNGRLSEVVVASHDAAGLAAGLEAVAAGGVPVTVLGFRERGGYAVSSPSLGFVDLEDVAGAYGASLPRTNLYDLPEEGRALAPLRRRGRRGAGTVNGTSTSTTPDGAGDTGDTSSTGGANRDRWFQSPEAAPATATATPAAAEAAVTTEKTETTSLDELLSGLRPPSMAGQPSSPRPGRVAPPNGRPD
jgi:uncharacterized protein